ncbi:MAG: 8-oxo-dGTP diphosphatase [archaeon]|jgi:8-oxo-dGTP diphosphatase|nr:8-oxo-dGTP diphosphatase [archaeon]
MAKERPKRQATLCIILDRAGDRILLAMKKAGFGKGKYNGFGGKLLDGETIEEAAVRELKEESNLAAAVSDLEKVGEFDFYFPHKPEFNQTVHVYLIENYQGEPEETNEMAYEWFNLGEIPYSRMWDDDKYWLPLVLQGKKLAASFTFRNENNENLVEHKDIKELSGF